jgi:hypothetical protein
LELKSEIPESLCCFSKKNISTFDSVLITLRRAACFQHLSAPFSTFQLEKNLDRIKG